MPWVGLEPTIPAFERVNAVHALDRGDSDRQDINVDISVQADVCIAIIWKYAAQYICFTKLA
jgi:hypothetical protein